MYMHAKRSYCDLFACMYTRGTSDLYDTHVEDPGSSTCKAGGGISVSHLDSTLSAVPVFPSSAFVPGHGPGRLNCQDHEPMSELGGLWKHQSNPACTKNVGALIM